MYISYCLKLYFISIKCPLVCQFQALYISALLFFLLQALLICIRCAVIVFIVNCVIKRILLLLAECDIVLSECLSINSRRTLSTRASRFIVLLLTVGSRSAEISVMESANGY